MPAFLRPDQKRMGMPCGNEPAPVWAGAAVEG